MGSALRKTGVDILGDVPWGTHFCHFYQTRQDLDDIIFPYLNTGLANNELCQLVIANPLNHERSKLRRFISSFDKHLAIGMLEIYTYSESFFENDIYNPQRVMDNWKEKLKKVSTGEIAGLRVAVDGAWMDERYWDGFSEFEKEIDPLFSGKNIMILCGYPIANIKAPAIFDVTDTHQFAVARRHGQWGVFESPELNQARIEIEKLNEELEQTVIERTNDLAQSNDELAQSNDKLRREIEERRTAIEFLNILNQSKSIDDLIKKAISAVSRKIGCDAVGIRLRKEHDYPYYATLGFPPKFVKLENSLCARDEKGEICFDGNGDPVLECMCGNVICGRFDPKQSFFTDNGSFWTHSTTELLAKTAEHDRQGRTRNRCHSEGYESVALIPLRFGEERLGILQLNDKRKAFFSAETVAMWERLSDYLSVSLSRLFAEEALQQMNATLEQQVSERTKVAEARARQLQSLAVELVQAEEFERQRIADFLHDDLQQLIASARMQVQSAFQKEDPVPTLKNVERMLEESLEKSRHLSQELSPPVLHHFGLAASLEWLVRHMDEQFSLKVHLETEMPDEIKDPPLKVYLFRAVQELLFNCVKHSGVKNADIRLYGSDDKITLHVSDQGRGFDPGILDSFDRKTGFGLVSLRERTAAIGGRLDIESAPGEGSRFFLTVPVNLAAVRQSGRNEGVSIAPSGIFENQISEDTDTIRVLLADDHKVMRQGLIGIIADQPGIQVAGEAASGEEALAFARRLKPDVIIMDVSMPGMGGVEATRQISSEMPGIRVIGLSMFTDEDSAKQMLQAGAEVFLSKTVSSSELLKEIYEIAR